MTATTPPFGQTMTALRLKRGWTQGDLAAQIGVHKNSIVGWENGRNEPPISKFAAIAKALGVSLDALWGAPERAEAAS